MSDRDIHGIGKLVRQKIWLLGVALLMVLAACSASSDESDAGAEETTPDTDTNVEEPTDADDPITITYTSVGATGSAIMDQVEWFAEEIETRTDGRVEFELFLDGTLVGAAETLKAVQDGRADAGYMCDCYNPNEFPVWSLFSMPFLGNNADAYMLTAAEMYQSGGPLTDEFAGLGLHANWFHTIGAGLTYLREPIDGIEGMDGKRLRAIGLTAQALPAVGAEPVAMDPGEIYESVQRGAIDGVGTFFFPTAYSFGIHEVAPHVVDAGTGFYASVGFIMNDDVWSSLSPDIQTIFNEVSDELMAEKAIDIYEAASEAACDGFMEAGGSITIFAEDEVSSWREDVLPGMVEEWKQNVVDNTDLTEEDAESFRNRFLDTYERNAAASDHIPDAEACAAQQS